MQSNYTIKLASDIGGVNFQASNTGGKLRTFSGIANSGKPFGYGAVQMVLDFAGIAIKPKTAVLLEHNPHKGAGVATLSVDAISGCLNANGVLVDNEFGRYIAELSDNHFPWEMSVHVDAKRYEEIPAGEKLSVNGHEITGPMVVMRDCAIREVSFTPVGVDGATSAVVLSNGAAVSFQYSQSQPTQTEQPSMTMSAEEQAAFDALKAELAELKAENAQLKKQQKKDKAKAKLSAAGFKRNDKGEFDGVSAPMLSAILSASDEDADAMIADLAAKLSANAGDKGQPEKPNAPAALFAGLNGTAGEPSPSNKLSAAATVANKQGKHYV
jgi:hypothetical protein|nr:MAG TPA: prohead serine protease [Caudoviricetes sp.]